MLGVSERKLRELLPEIPHIHTGGVVLVPLERWLRERAVAEQARADVAAEEVLRSVSAGDSD